MITQLSKHSCNKKKSAKSGKMRTDGQSLWSFDTRIAEHIPDGEGQGATIVYDYTYGGGHYISPTYILTM